MDLGDGGILQSVVETYEILGFEKRERSQLFQEHLEDHVIEVRVYVSDVVVYTRLL